MLSCVSCLRQLGVSRRSYVKRLLTYKSRSPNTPFDGSGANLPLWHRPPLRPGHKETPAAWQLIIFVARPVFGSNSEEAPVAWTAAAARSRELRRIRTPPH